MQLHEHPGAAPALAALTHDRGGKRMRFDAIAHAELKNGQNSGKWHKKTDIQGAGLSRFCRYYWPRNAPIILLRHMLATIRRIIVVQGFS